MHNDYKDILEAVGDKRVPSWYDENGTPRFGQFSPDLSPNIYANEVVLLRIACQACGKEFYVEMSWSKTTALLSGRPCPSFSESLEAWLKAGRKGWAPLHYGDPPAHGSGCWAGATMNCIDLKVERFYNRPRWGWERVKKYEVRLEETPEAPVATVDQNVDQAVAKMGQMSLNEPNERRAKKASLRRKTRGSTKKTPK